MPEPKWEIPGTVGADRTLPQDQAYEEWTETIRITGFGAAIFAAGHGGSVSYPFSVNPGTEISEIILTFDDD